MEALLHTDLGGLVLTVGYFGLLALIFAESGVFGFFLPGDSVLFAAGVLATQGVFDIGHLLGGVVAAAVLGAVAGYWLGEKLGPRLFTKENSLLFNKSHIKKTQDYYERYGAQTLILARFIPVARTFAPMLAGVAGMPRPLFLRYTIAGALLWGVGCTLLGYLVGNTIPNAHEYLLPIVVGIVLVSALPMLFHFSVRLRAA